MCHIFPVPGSGELRRAWQGAAGQPPETLVAPPGDRFCLSLLCPVCSVKTRVVVPRGFPWLLYLWCSTDILSVHRDLPSFSSFLSSLGRKTQRKATFYLASGTFSSRRAQQRSFCILLLLLPASVQKFEREYLSSRNP